MKIKLKWKQTLQIKLSRYTMIKLRILYLCRVEMANLNVGNFPENGLRMMIIE